MTTARPPLPESQMGPAEQLLDVVLGASAHLWHNRPGLDVARHVAAGEGREARRRGGKPVKPGLFVPAAVALYTRLLEIHKLNADLMAHLASYALVETDWRDLKVACAALMLVQARAGAAGARRRRLGRVLRRRLPPDRRGDGALVPEEVARAC